MNTTLDFSLSETAARRIAVLLQDEPEGSYFRVAVDGGGCSGFQYRFDLENTPLAEDEHLIEKAGARAVVDDASLEFLSGSQLDYTTQLVGSAFVVNNPQAVSGCGCGNSFSV